MAFLKAAAMVAWASVVAVAQATVPQIYVSAAVPGEAGRTMSVVIFDPSLTFARDALNRIHLSGNGLTMTLDDKVIGSAGTIRIASGKGIIVAASHTDNSEITLQLGIDTSLVAYRTTVPVNPGPCPHTESPATPEGFGGWAADLTGFYVCVADGNGEFVWARVSAVQPMWTDSTISMVAVAIVNENPLPSPTAAQTWILTKKPMGAVQCTIDGVMRADFSIMGNLIVSQTIPADVGLPSMRFACSYSFIPALQ